MTHARKATTWYTIKAFTGKPTIRLHAKDLRAPQQRQAAQYRIGRDSRKLQHLQCASSAVASAGGQEVLEDTCTSCQWEVREATAQELWHVSELHCRSFHPTAQWLNAVLQRFDRLSSFQAAESQMKAGWGQFACLIAICRPSRPRTPFVGSATSPGAISVPSFLNIFVPAPYKAGLEMSLEEAGIIGTVCVDSTGQFVPMKERNGQLYKREEVAYLSNLAVDHNFRRQGIGKQLLDQAAEVAREWGCRSITLQCDPRNRGAREMYARGGYRHVSYESPFSQFWEGRIGVRLELMCKRLST